MKILYIIFLSIIIAAAKDYPLSSNDKKDYYFVMAPHTPDKCRKAQEDMKAKDEFQLSKFYFGCNYNDHILYGVWEEASEEDVRNSLHSVLQTNAKIKSVDKTSATD